MLLGYTLEHNWSCFQVYNWIWNAPPILWLFGIIRVSFSAYDKFKNFLSIPLPSWCQYQSSLWPINAIFHAMQHRFHVFISWLLRMSCQVSHWTVNWKEWIFHYVHHLASPWPVYCLQFWRPHLFLICFGQHISNSGLCRGCSFWKIELIFKTLQKYRLGM